jgi:hypothetical protein
MNPAELFAAALIQFAIEESQGIYKGPSHLLVKGASSVFKIDIDADFPNESLEILRNLDLIRDHMYEGMAPYLILDTTGFSGRFKIQLGKTRMYHISARLDGGKIYPILESYADLGVGWLLEAIDVYNSNKTTGRKHLGEQAHVPASDRIVRFDDNETAHRAIVDQLELLEQHIETGNDVGDLSPEEVEAAKSEVSALKQIFSSSIIRVKAAKDAAVRTLGWIGDKASAAAVGELAKGVLKLILAALGWSL